MSIVNLTGSDRANRLSIAFFACRRLKRLAEKELTSENTALLEVVHTLARIALAQFFADETRHHAAYPLLADNGITGVVNGDIVLEVDSLVGRGDGGLFGEERGGFGGRHFGWLVGFVGRYGGLCLLEGETTAARAIEESWSIKGLDAVVRR